MSDLPRRQESRPLRTHRAMLAGWMMKMLVLRTACSHRIVVFVTPRWHSAGWSYTQASATTDRPPYCDLDVPYRDSPAKLSVSNHGSVRAVSTFQVTFGRQTRF